MNSNKLLLKNWIRIQVTEIADEIWESSLIHF